MDSRSVAFLEVMIAIGVIGVIAFLIFLISRHAMRGKAVETGVQGTEYRPQWYEFLLAAIVVAVIVVLLLWQFPPGANFDWSSDSRSLTFFVIMLAIGGLGLIVFILTVFWRSVQQKRESAGGGNPGGAAARTIVTESSAGAGAAEPTASHESPSAVRLLGLLGFGVAFVILNWSYVPPADQFAMILYLIYPAGLIIALVMLFDKASRAWNIKMPGETLREWLFCDAILLLYLIGYLNLLQSGVGDEYAAMFWDFLNVIGFLFLFWIIDRKATRLRFLIAHAYLIALPILLLIWRAAQGVEVAADISWWRTIWPFFFLAIVFFVLEIIILIANRESQSQAVATAKDLVFFALYVILLIAARPEAVA